MSPQRIAGTMLVLGALSACQSAPYAGAPGAATSPGNACRLSLAASLPLIMAAHGSKLLIDAKMEGTPLTLIVDTGAESILLNRSAAARASRTTTIGSLIGGSEDADPAVARAEAFTTGIGGARVVSRLQIDDLELGRLHGSFAAHVTDAEIHTPDHAVDGLLGMSVLDNFDVDLDLAGGRLNLFSAAGDCAHPAVALDQPIYATPLLGGYRSELRERVPVTINGQPFTALLDSGAPGILLFAHTARALALAGTASAKPLHITGVGGSDAISIAEVDRLAVGPLALRHVRVAIDQADMGDADLLLGLSFMKRVHVWLSNSSHMLVMQYPPLPSPPVP